MDKMIINILDGTVTNTWHSVIVDVSTLDDAGRALLQEWAMGGNDSDAIELGKQYGTKIDTEQAVA